MYNQSNCPVYFNDTETNLLFYLVNLNIFWQKQNYDLNHRHFYQTTSSANFDNNSPKFSSDKILNINFKINLIIRRKIKKTQIFPKYVYSQSRPGHTGIRENSLKLSDTFYSLFTIPLPRIYCQTIHFSLILISYRMVIL